MFHLHIIKLELNSAHQNLLASRLVVTPHENIATQQLFWLDKEKLYNRRKNELKTASRYLKIFSEPTTALQLITLPAKFLVGVPMIQLS